MHQVKVFFETLERKKIDVVLFGNNKACKVQGMRLVKLKMFHNMKILLPDLIKYVLELKKNLFVD